ncbi:MAG: hypothetical protein AB9880_12245 [Christensenellales bacterium]
MRPSSRFRKPFITAALFLLAGIMMMAAGALLARGGEMGYYALAVFGLLFAITGLVTFALYGALARRARQILRGEPLLHYQMDEASRRIACEKNIREIREANKALLRVMLLFCGLFAIVLPFFVEERLLMVLICLGLAAFLTLAALIITAYRMRKVRRGGAEVILTRGGALLADAFHAWDLPGTGLQDFELLKPEAPSGLHTLSITYTADAGPTPPSQTIVLMIPSDLAPRLPGVLAALEEVRGEG